MLVEHWSQHSAFSPLSLPPPPYFSTSCKISFFFSELGTEFQCSDYKHGSAILHACKENFKFEKPYEEMKWRLGYSAEASRKGYNNIKTLGQNSHFPFDHKFRGF
jgi:hypothetical protein